MITRYLYRYSFRKMAFGADLSAADIRKGFVFRFKLGKYPTADTSTTLLEYPGQLRISTRYLKGGYKFVPADDQLANYTSFTDDRGGRQLLEAEIRIHYADRPGATSASASPTGEMGILDERDYPDLPPLGASYMYSSDGVLEPMRNSCECPSFFSWNGHRYLIMGVTGFWTATGNGPYENSAAEGYDIYDGLAVPMVAPYHDDRRLIGGWLKGIGWGSCLILRELTFHKGGRLGMKWPAELMPSRERPVAGSETMTFKKGEVYTEPFPSGASRFYEIRIDPGKGRAHFAMRFIDKTHPGESCEIQLNFGEKRAQFAPCPSAPGMFWHTLMTCFKAGRLLDLIRNRLAQFGQVVLVALAQRLRTDLEGVPILLPEMHHPLAQFDKPGRHPVAIASRPDAHLAVVSLGDARIGKARRGGTQKCPGFGEGFPGFVVGAPGLLDKVLECFGIAVARS